MEAKVKKEVGTGIKDWQRKMIFGTCRGYDIDSDDLHNICQAVTGKSSIRELTEREAHRLIDRLKEITGQAPTTAHNRPTKAQTGKIYALAGELGWDHKRLSAFLEAKYKTSLPEWLSDKYTQSCIIALKSMVKGGRGERKGYHHAVDDG